MIRMLDAARTLEADERNALAAVEEAFAETAPWYYIPHAVLFLRGKRIAMGAEDVSTTVQHIFEGASDITLHLDDGFVRATAMRRNTMIIAEFEVRFGLIGSVDVRTLTQSSP